MEQYPRETEEAKIVIVVDDSFDQMAYRLAIIKREDGKRYHAKIEWVEHEPYNVMARDSWLMMPHESPNSRRALADLMDQLWRIGIRPTVPFEKDIIEAKQQHIDDYRGITKTLLGKVCR